MKKLIFICFGVVFLTGKSWGQDDLVKQKALQIRDANNARQGVISSAATSPAIPVPAAPSGPQGIAPAQQQLIDRLESDFAIIKTGTPATAAQKQAMADQMGSLAKGSAKPTKPQLAKLAADLSLALAEKSFNAHDTALLAKDLNIIVNCSPLTSSRAQTFVTEIQNTIKHAGVSDGTTQTVVNDLRAVVTEIQQNKPKLYQ